MESLDDKNKNMINRSGKVWLGILIVGIGSLLLLRNFGLYMPYWLFKWSTLLIAIGLIVGIRHQFRNSAWFVMVLIGSFFALKDIFREYDMSNVVLPLMLVALGIYLIVKPKESGFWCRSHPSKKRSDPSGPAEEEMPKQEEDRIMDSLDPNDYIESVNVFGGSNQMVYSKNFKGGEVVAVFGGGDVNLSQANFEGQIKLECTVIFGGLKIVVPPSWKVRSEVTAIFGGVDDKRMIQPIEQYEDKVIVITGVVLFGGVEIKNY